MISSLRGVVLALGPGSAVLEVAGVGYAIAITPGHALSLRLGEEALVHTALIVREDELSLCGFASREELEVFDLLRGVTGVGPKSALGVLAAMSPAQVAAAVGAEDDAAFRKVSGIGPKTAKLIVVTLAGKLPTFAASAPAPVRVQEHSRLQAQTALEGLGFPGRRAAEALDAVLAEHDGGELGVQAIVRLALAELGSAGVR